MALGSPKKLHTQLIKLAHACGFVCAEQGISCGHTHMVGGYIKTGPRQIKTGFRPATQPISNTPIRTPSAACDRLGNSPFIVGCASTAGPTTNYSCWT